MNKKFVVIEKVRFQHCDFAGIVFYPRYYEMINCLVEDWFEELGLPFNEMHEQHFGVPTKQLNVTFKKATRLNDRLEKQLSIKSIGNSSLVLNIVFYHNNELVLEAESVLVFVKINADQHNLQSHQWLPTLKENMQVYIAQV